MERFSEKHRGVLSNKRVCSETPLYVLLKNSLYKFHPADCELRKKGIQAAESLCQAMCQDSCIVRVFREIMQGKTYASGSHTLISFKSRFPQA